MERPRKSSSIQRNHTKQHVCPQKLFRGNPRASEKANKKNLGRLCSSFGDDLPQDMAITAIDPAVDATHLPSFYCQIKSAMISKQIEGSLDESSFKTIFAKKKELIWTDPITGAQEFDGPTMLQLTVNSINPTTCVGVSDCKIDIQNTILQKFSNNVQEMVDFVEANYEEIVPHNFTHPDYTIHLLNALLTSKNKMSRSVI